MDKKYWDELANNFEHNVFEVFKNDVNGVLLRAIHTYGGLDKTACDIGCGVGSLLPKLSEAFAEVVAIDLSPKCLEKAANNCAAYSNISYIDCDLSSATTNIPAMDFGLCVNALIFPSLKGRINFLNNSVAALNKNGILLLVVPSLESALLRNHREVEWNIKTDMLASEAEKTPFVGIDGLSAKKLSLGMVKLDGVETKHFLKEEIYSMLERRGLAVLDISKLEYGWDTEFFNPPKWMQAPYPWDWCCLAKKI